MNTQAKALMEAHLEHIVQQVQLPEVILAEVDAFIKWLDKITLKQMISLKHLQHIAKQQVLGLPFNKAAQTEVVNIIQAAFDHPLNKDTPLEALVPDEIIERIAVFFSEQKDHREKLLHEVFHNPTYVDMLSQTISHAITDYMENNVLTKNVPGVSSLMKFGKGMLERATSSSLDDALQQYLNKNINNLTNISEKMANRHLTDKQVYALIKQGWNQVKRNPTSNVRLYADEETVTDTADLISQMWEHLRINKYIQTQVKDGVAAWYGRNSDKTIITLLGEINITPKLVHQEVTEIYIPLIKQIVDTGYLAKRVMPLLQAFYESEAVSTILNK